MTSDHLIREFALLVLLGFALSPNLQAQAPNDEYAYQASLAHGYIQERRYQDALGALRRAYEVRPNTEILSDMGKVFLALGMATEAEDVLSQALAQGGEISFELLHRHGFGQCYGTLREGVLREWEASERRGTQKVSE